MRPVDPAGNFKLVELQSMTGFSVGIKYFDDDKRVFVSPEIADKFEAGELGKLDFLTLSYRSGQKDIEEIIKEIVDEMALVGGGKPNTEIMADLHNRHNKNIREIEASDIAGQGTPLFRSS